MAATESALARFASHLRRRNRTHRRDALAYSIVGLATFTSACTLEAAEGDGLFIADAGAAFVSSQDPITGAPGASTSGTPDGSSGGTPPASTGGTGGGSSSARACANVAGFTMKATPLLIRDCSRCHNGTKGKATQLLDLTLVKDMSAASQQVACGKTLTTTDLSNPRASTIFTFVDPSNAATVHDFKYATPAEFTAFQSSVLAWLETE